MKNSNKEYTKLRKFYAWVGFILIIIVIVALLIAVPTAVIKLVF